MPELCRELAEDWGFGNQASVSSSPGLLSALGQVPAPPCWVGESTSF